LVETLGVFGARTLEGGCVNILFLATEAYGAPGGIAQANRDLAAALAAAPGVDGVTVLVRSGSAGAGVPSGVAQRAPRSSRAAYALAALREARRRPSLVLCGHANMATLGSWAAARAGVPLWTHTHGIEVWRRPGSSIRAAIEGSRLVTAVSRFTRGKLLEWSRIAPERVKVLPDTVREGFSPGPKAAHVLARHGLEGKKVILTVGRFSAAERYKGHDRVIRVLPRLAAAGHDVAYLVVGDGDDRARLECIARESGAAERVTFAGAVKETELPDYYRAADAFAMPSVGEGFGIVFLEAAATGLPVVAGNRDGSVDALREGALGRLVDPADEFALENALAEALARPRVAIPGISFFSRERFAAHARSLLALALGGVS